MISFSRACAVFFSISCMSVLAEFVVPPAPTGHILDEVGLLSPSEEQSLEQTLGALEAETHHQIGIAIIKSLQNRSIEEAGLAIARTWGIGQKGVDNGLLILIAPTEREIRIEVGRGLEGVITDVTSKRIIDEYIMPVFQQPIFVAGLSGGIEAAIQVMTPLLRGEVVNLPPAEMNLIDAIMPFLFLILFFGWSFLSILSASKAWWLGGLFGAIIGGVIGGLYGAGIGLVSGLILDFFLSKYAYQKIPLIKNFQNHHSGGFGSGSSGGWGGFGGGGFGGGGASGRW